MLTRALHPRWPRARALRRIGALAVAATLIVSGCASVERTATERDFLRDQHDVIERALVWDSNRYPSHQAYAGDGCWDAAAVGQPVPVACLTARELLDETDPHAQWPLVAYLATALAIAAFLWFAARRIAWQPSVARHAAEEGDPPAGRGDAVALMRGISREKVAQHAAAGRRRDVRRPALVGAAVAAAGLVIPILLVGYAATLAWAIHTGTIMFAGLAVAVVLLLLRLPPRPADPDAYISRLQFLGGATVLLTAVAFLAAVFFHTPMVELNGISLLG